MWYDIAGNFNEHGYAMVGKDGCVSWINKKFEYLSRDGHLISENPNNLHEKFYTWDAVYQFSSGSIPLSKLYKIVYDSGIVSYMGTNGQLQEFFCLKGRKHQVIAATNLIML